MADFAPVSRSCPPPSSYLALAAVLATRQAVLPAIFTHVGAVLGIAFLLIGLIAVVIPGATAATRALAGLQALWILAAGITARRSSSSWPRARFELCVSRP